MTHEFSGSNERAFARMLQLVSLLLDGPHERQRLSGELLTALETQGWQGAIKSDADGLRNLARDVGTLRDLQLLKMPRGRTYRATPGDRLPLWVTPEEALALAAAADGMAQMGLPEASALYALLERIPSAVREAGRRRVVQLAPSVRVVDEARWAAIQRAVVEGRQLQITYQKPTGEPPETFTLDRGQVVWLTGAYYLVAYRPHYAMTQPGKPGWRYVREYRLDRILDAVCLDSPVSLTALPPVRCRVVLDAELRDRVVTLRGADGRVLQYAEALPDRTVRVTFEDVSVLRARQRILAWGPHLLAVEEPDALRDEVMRAIRALTSNFGAENSALDRPQ